MSIHRYKPEAAACIKDDDKSVPDMSQQELDTFCEGLSLVATSTQVSEEELLEVLAKYVKHKEFDYILGEIKDQYA